MISKILDRVFSVVGALVFVQIPGFMQQYTYILQGHLSELNYQISLFQGAAEHLHKSLQEYIQKFLDSKDADFTSQGKILADLVDRQKEMTHVLSVLQDAALWKKPFIFLANLDISIAKETFRSFEPSLYMSLESLIYLFVGLLAGFLFYRLLRKLYGSIRNKA